MTPCEDGSVFIEALASTAIVALILAAVFRVSADSAVHHRMVEERRYALMIARSELAAVGSAIPLATGSMEGTDGQDIWRVDMQPCDSDAASNVGALYCVEVSVRKAQDQAPLITLSSRRLAPSAA